MPVYASFYCFAFYYENIMTEVYDEQQNEHKQLLNPAFMEKSEELHLQLERLIEEKEKKFMKVKPSGKKELMTFYNTYYLELGRERMRN
jgi:hypothetical protein